MRLNNKEYAVKKGDFITKEAGKNIAHTFYNSSDCMLIILDVGTNQKEDTCYYPDEEIYVSNQNGENLSLKKQSIIYDLKLDPNENK